MRDGGCDTAALLVTEARMKGMASGGATATYSRGRRASRRRNPSRANCLLIDLEPVPWTNRPDRTMCSPPPYRLSGVGCRAFDPGMTRGIWQLNQYIL